MRFVIPLTGAVLMGILGTAIFANASFFTPRANAQEKAQEKSGTASAQPDAALSPTPVVIAPHKAVYSMRLLSARNGSDVTGVDGKMSFEWNDACDGWTTVQASQMVFSYSDGASEHIDSSQSTWEAKDGTAYRFNYRRVADDKETEVYRGKASMTPDGGEAIYSEPADKRVELEKGVLFPSAHTIEILKRAAGGELFFSRRVFDGTDEAGLSDVSSFISPRAVARLDDLPRGRKGKTTAAKVSDDSLLRGTMRAVRLAYFRTGDEATGVSDYEMDMDLLSNGVAKSMRVDYSDFSVIAVLEDVKALPSPECK